MIHKELKCLCQGTLDFSTSYSIHMDSELHLDEWLLVVMQFIVCEICIRIKVNALQSVLAITQV